LILKSPSQGWKSSEALMQTQQGPIHEYQPEVGKIRQHVVKSPSQELNASEALTRTQQGPIVESKPDVESPSQELNASEALTQTQQGPIVESKQEVGNIRQNGVTSGEKNPRSPEEVEGRRQDALKRRTAISVLRPVQKEALDCICDNNINTMIIMPTGSGKTRLIWYHKLLSYHKDGLGKCTVIFAPFKILVEQLTLVLMEHGTVFTHPFSRESSSFAMITTADYVIMPYEAAPDSADLLTSLHNIGRLGPIWIDEVRYVE
jgi:hypothetical protein